ncbi:putative RNA-directed DNA polymerase from transposon BS [Metarhizium anisopliae]|nr:putative RNA-directed DNA polymerase from transposon BS [Metarhizium anisopliae]
MAPTAPVILNENYLRSKNSIRSCTVPCSSLYTKETFDSLGRSSCLPGSCCSAPHQLGRFGYADNTAILRTGRTLRGTAKLATADVRELISWGAANSITFDPEKTEVMHFSHKKDDTSPSVTHGGIAKVPAEAIRWLGTWLDKKLTFRTHIEKWAAKAKKVAGHLHGLCNTKHGPLPAVVRQAVKACVEPILLYGMEAWYTGTDSYTAWHGTKKVRPQIQHLVVKLDPVLRRAIRAILPLWKTTSVPIYHQESGIPPAALLLEARRIQFAARLKSLDLAHPLAQRTAPHRSYAPSNGPAKSEEAALRLDWSGRPCSSPIPPTLIQASDTAAAALQTKNKDESAADFLKWLEGISPDELVVYSDGSQLPGGATGYGYVVHQNSVTICGGSGRLGPAEVFDAEAVSALEGLRAEPFLAVTQSEVDSFSAALRVYSTKARVNEYNYEHMVHLHAPAIQVEAKNQGKGAAQAPSDNAGNLSNKFPIAKGAR